MCSASVKHLQLLTSYCHHHKCTLFLCNFHAPAGASAVSTDASIQSFAERNTRDIAFVAVEHGLGRAWQWTPKDFASHVEDGLMRAKKAPDSDRSIRTTRYQEGASWRGAFRPTARHARYALLMQTPPLSANGRSRCFEQVHPASHFLHAVAWSQVRIF